MLSTFFLLLSLLLGTVAFPLQTDSNGASNDTTVTRVLPGPPYFVIYSDKFVPAQNGPPPVSDIRGFNVFALSFLLTSGAVDQALAWTLLSDSQRAAIKSQYSAAGIKVIVSLFGSTEVPTSSGVDPIATAKTMAGWVKKYNVDGVDVDYEDFNAFDATDGRAEAWLVTFTQHLRYQLPKGKYILTHAPVAPWFEPNRWGGGGYLKVNSAVGNLIDWYNVQFYNQGTTEYTTCPGLLTSSFGQFPKSSLFEIEKNGIPLSKLVIGKPATARDASNGYMPAPTLATCLKQAKSQGWGAGVMVWEYPSAGTQWIREVRSLAFPE